MATKVGYVKNGIQIECDTSTYPAPRPKAAWPMPLFPCTESSLLQLSLYAVSGQNTSGIQVQSTGVLPGSSSAQWSLFHQYYQGTPASLPFPEFGYANVVGGILNQTFPAPMANATHNFWLQRDDGGRITFFPLSTITTPQDPSITLDAMTPADQASAVTQWGQLWITKGYLDTDGATLGVSTATYDGYVATLFNQLALVATGTVGTWNGTGALPTPSWVTQWPTTGVLAKTAIKTSLGTWWGNIASSQAALQKALASAAAASAIPMAIGDGATNVYLYPGSGTVKVNGLVQVNGTNYNLSGAMLTFVVTPAPGALLQGVSSYLGTGNFGNMVPNPNSALGPIPGIGGLGVVDTNGRSFTGYNGCRYARSTLLIPAGYQPCTGQIACQFGQVISVDWQAMCYVNAVENWPARLQLAFYSASGTYLGSGNNINPGHLSSYLMGGYPISGWTPGQWLDWNFQMAAPAGTAYVVGLIYGYSGNEYWYGNLSVIPSATNIGVAAPTVAGLVRVGTGLAVDESGLLSTTGTPGVQGPPGPAGATIAVGTTNTGAPGTAASVTNVGTTSAAILNFVIPTGPVGATGAQGTTGATGAKGDTGATGATGNTGAQGVPGNPWPYNIDGGDAFSVPWAYSLDGGRAASVYGGIQPLNCGGAI